MKELVVIDIQTFIENYRQFSQSLEAEKFDQYKHRFDGIIGGYQVLSEALDAHDAHFAERYNLFSILNIKWRETAMHTPFLKNLLDIHGEHAQGALFYQGFLETLIQPTDARRQIFGRITKHHLEVIEELPTVFGRIDIFIRHFSNDNPFCICIENKIYAPDQPQQLDRYHAYMKDTLRLKDEQILLVYLTIDGKEPPDYSISAERYKELKAKGVIVCMSYREGVKEWLASCIQKVKAPAIQSIINQYLKTIVEL